MQVLRHLAVMQEKQDLPELAQNATNQFKEYKATLAHTSFALVSMSFLVFEVLFIVLYSVNSWFSTNLSLWGVPAILLALAVTHCLLLFQESTIGCVLFSFIGKGYPVVVYRRWVRVNDPMLAPGIRFGNHNVIWSAISHAELTLWGNLLLRSSTVTGESSGHASNFAAKRLQRAQVVLKLPFGVVAHNEQTELIQRLQQAQPHVVLNDRLRKRLEAKEIKAASIVPIFGAVFMLLVLIDVGFSTFNYLEMLKCYYLSDTAAVGGDMKTANESFVKAENIRTHPLPISWVTAKLMSNPPVAPGVYEERAKVLWHLNKRDEAIQSMQKAVDMSPKAFRYNLALARMFVAQGKTDQAKAQLDNAMASKPDSFLPQLYMVALKQGQAPAVKKETLSAYVEYKSKLDDDLFKDEPRWPPGNNLFLHDIWYNEDMQFVFDRLVGEQRH